MAQIEPNGKNAILAGLLNWCIFGCAGYYYLGQSKKGLWALIVSFVLGWTMIPQLLFAYDAYVLGQKLQNGEPIRENEVGLEFLGSIFGIFGVKDE